MFGHTERCQGHVPREEGTHSKMSAICKPRKKALPETNPTRTLILDLQPPELRKNKFQLLKPPSPWHFVVAGPSVLTQSLYETLLSYLARGLVSYQNPDRVKQ